MIDVADVKTIPVEVKDIILNSFESLPISVVNEIKSTEIQYPCDVMCAIEDRYSPRGNINFYDKLISTLEKYDIVCFHSTKMLSKDCILEHGLKVNDWERYRNNLIMVYRTLGYTEDKIEKAIDIVNHEYKRKYSGEREGSQFYFYSNLSMLESEYAPAYDQFCESIGGELARWALKTQYPELYKPLKENGNGFVVKFKMPFANIAYYEKDSIAYHFVLYYAGVYFWNKEFEIEFDGNTQCNIPPEDILEIIQYDKEIDYE